MTSKDDSPPVMSRRNFLKTSTFAGVGLGLGTAGLLSSALAQATTTISFQGWAFEPQVVEASVKRFMAENPDIRVNYTPLDLQLYAEKMVALFNAGTQGDAFYVRDTHLGAWVEAGWLQPIDGLPKLAELNRDIYPATLQTLFYKGKQYGVPYYGDIYVYLYDKSQLEKAGVKKVPVTLDELKSAALEVKKAGISQYPILKGYKTNTDGLDEFWSMVFSSGGHLFDASMDPLFPNEDKTAVMVLEWMLDAMHTWKILDPRGLEIDETQARDIYVSGQGTFASNVGNVFPRANNPALSKRAGNIQMMRFPGLKDVNKGPMGWSRLYAMSSQTKHRDAAWRLLYFMGGKDANGRYDVAKDWYLKYGVGFPFKSLEQDPDIIASQKKTGYDLDILRQQLATAQVRENVLTTWYAEWDRYMQQQIQNVLLRQIKPTDAMAASAKKAQELKKSAI
ncbi:MAG TPA: sugar ABC transporter substrate-binding protein [Terriglobales bacterium]|nr:sugar ABC transporter substrate-binding protein [Terriglobales bacterium]